MATALPSQARLQELFTYEPLTGVLRWRKTNSSRAVAGSAAGHLSRIGYFQVRVDKKLFYAHRLVWMLVYGEDPGPKGIDHVDRDKSNNRLVNLRLANQSQNGMNRDHPIRSLPLGVSTNKARFRARLGGAHLGTFDTPEEAHAAYCAAAADFHGEFARTA
jgi:hypothetical protein